MLIFKPNSDVAVDSDLTDAEARKICEQGDAFCRSLASTKSLSASQHYWLHLKAIEIRNSTVQLPTGSYQRMVDMFNRVTNLQVKDIIFRAEYGTVRWMQMHNRIVIKCGQRVVGKIEPNDVLTKNKMHAKTLKLTVELVKSPVAAAILFGQITKTCCFCGRALETPESVTAGYGPVCADNWGLPWGEVDKNETNAKVTK